MEFYDWLFGKFGITYDEYKSDEDLMKKLKSLVDLKREVNPDLADYMVCREIRIDLESEHMIQLEKMYAEIEDKYKVV